MLWLYGKSGKDVGLYHILISGKARYEGKWYGY